MSSSKQLISLNVVCSAFTMFSFYIHVSGVTNTMINFVDENHPNLEKQSVTNGDLSWSADYQKTLSN